jgi:hypothetical protein
MLMGGRAAERLVFRMVTSGASDDLKVSPASYSTVEKLRGFGTGRQKMALNDGKIPNLRGVRVVLSVRAAVMSRESRNGLVSDLPPLRV